MRRVQCLCVAVAIFASFSGAAAVINVAPGDSYTKIESAQPGDEVVIAPGTYSNRIYLTRQATATNPIVIRAQDPNNRPVWDFGTTLVENAPGSYTAGDRGRGGWQFSGAKNYRLSGIVFKHCRTASFNSAGVRFYSGSTNIYLKDCLFVQNDDGLTGGSQNSEITVEFCEFDSNGNTNASSSSPTHNIYIYGGTFTMRYSYVHDPVQSQNFHIRAHDSVIEYNWFARAKAYEGDLMSDDDYDGAGSGPFKQTMTLQGNVIVQSASPNNNGQVVAMYNDESLPNLTLTVRALYNTFIGNGGHAAFIHLSNADATQMNAEESNDLIYGTTMPYLIENTNKATITGFNNWLPSNATIGKLVGTVQSANPGFRNAAAKDYTLAAGSVCIGAANISVYGLPGREYFQNETNKCQWRVRAAARDIGAMESTSAGNPVGPYYPVPLPPLNIRPSGVSLSIGWPLYAADFQLQQSDLIAPVSWASANFLISTSASELYVTFPPGAAREFYRLRN